MREISYERLLFVARVLLSDHVVHLHHCETKITIKNHSNALSFNSLASLSCMSSFKNVVKSFMQSALGVHAKLDYMKS